MTVTERYPRAFVASASLHGAIILAVLFSFWWSHRQHEEQPKIFELVAGEGDNYAATEAPAARTPEPTETVSVDLPAPTPIITRVPVIERAPEPEPTPVPPKPVPKPTPKPIEKAPIIEKAPEPKPEPAKPIIKPTSYRDFVKEQGPPKTTTKAAPPKPITTKSINLETVTKGVSGGSTASTVGAGGTAMTRAEMDLTDAYVALILQRIRQSMEAAGVTELNEVRVEFSVSASGVISNPKVLRSSGSTAFDRAVLTAFRSIRPIGPPPTGRSEAFRVNIRMQEAG